MEKEQDFPEIIDRLNSDTLVIDREDEDLREPPKFVVLIMNDDYTPMDFVVTILMEIFRKPIIEATTIMMQVHHRGSGVAGTYPKEIAETKAAQGIQAARGKGFPLHFEVQEE